MCRGGVERFIPVLLLLCVALQLCLVPQLLNLTIKQCCKNRMFLAKAQQRQRREGGKQPYVKQKERKNRYLNYMNPKGSL